MNGAAKPGPDFPIIIQHGSPEGVAGDGSRFSEHLSRVVRDKLPNIRVQIEEVVPENPLHSVFIVTWADEEFFRHDKEVHTDYLDAEDYAHVVMDLEAANRDQDTADH